MAAVVNQQQEKEEETMFDIMPFVMMCFTYSIFVGSISSVGLLLMNSGFPTINTVEHPYIYISLGVAITVVGASLLSRARLDIGVILIGVTTLLVTSVYRQMSMGFPMVVMSTILTIVPVLTVSVIVNMITRSKPKPGPTEYPPKEWRRQ